MNKRGHRGGELSKERDNMKEGRMEEEILLLRRYCRNNCGLPLFPHALT